jgi:hypothetical protein
MFLVVEILAEGMGVWLPVFASTWDPRLRHGSVVTCICQYMRSSLKARECGYLYWPVLVILTEGMGCGYLYLPVLEILAEGKRVWLPVLASTWDPRWRHGGVVTCICQYLRSSLKAWGCGYLYLPVLEILAEGKRVWLPVFASIWDPRWRHGCTSHQLYVNILISLQKYYYICVVT